MAKKESERFSGIPVRFRVILDCKSSVHDLIAWEHVQVLMCRGHKWRAWGKWRECHFHRINWFLSRSFAFDCNALYEKVHAGYISPVACHKKSRFLKHPYIPYITEARFDHCLYVGNPMRQNNCYVKLYLKTGLQDQSFWSSMNEAICQNGLPIFRLARLIFTGQTNRAFKYQLYT